MSTSGAADMAMPSPIPSLRPYQLEAAAAILDAVCARDARTISIQIARQGGKNELSAQIEMLLLLASDAGDIIKIAPSLRPQGLISLTRLWGRLRQATLAPPAERHGNVIAFGANRLVLLSAGPTSNVLGHTAGALMEVDEAQDIDPDRFSRDFRPMGASRATPAIFYGTPWTETSLLEQMKQRHLEQERRDGIRRHFQYDWQTVAAANPDYERFATEERKRLGEHNPAWRTQYCLETVPGSGRLFTPQQLASLQGDHSRKRLRDRELAGSLLVAGLDVAGLDVAGAALYRGADRDHTVLTVLQVLPAPSAAPGEPQPEPRLRILEQIDWPHAGHDDLLRQIEDILARTWRPQRLAIDMTGIGEAIAAALIARAQRHRCEIIPIRFTEQSKSRLGFGLLAAAGGRLTCYAQDGSPEYREFWHQASQARAAYKPNRLMTFHVDPARGHDDYIASLALAVEAAHGLAPRIARGRSRDQDEPGQL